MTTVLKRHTRQTDRRTDEQADNNDGITITILCIDRETVLTNLHR